MVTRILDWPRSDPYGPRVHPITGEAGRMHWGTDFAVAAWTPIPAVDAGVILDRGYSSGAGYWVTLRVDSWPDGYFDHFHMVEMAPLTPGTRVERGQTIGYVGSTGPSTGPHLHLEAVIAGGMRIDAIPVLEALAAMTEPTPPPAPIPLRPEGPFIMRIIETVEGQLHLQTALGSVHIMHPDHAALLARVIEGHELRMYESERQIINYYVRAASTADDAEHDRILEAIRAIDPGATTA